MKDKRLYVCIADKITRMIESGVYPAGARLPGERDLAEHFQVSRVTIREAEITLQAQGRLDIRIGSGAYVLDVNEAGNHGLPNVSALELTEARALFESEVAALAAPDISDATLAQLETYIREMGSSEPGNAEAAELADRNFHLTIAAASGNTVLRYIVETLWRMRTDLAPVKKVYDSVCSDDATLRGNEHKEIFDALCERNPLAARNAMRKHFTRLLESMLDVTERQALREVRRKASESRQRFLKSARI